MGKLSPLYDVQQLKKQVLIAALTYVIDGAAKFKRKLSNLPDAYATVPAASLPNKEFYAPSVPEGVVSDNYLTEGEEEYKWLKNLMELIDKGNMTSSDYISWAALHASKQMPSQHQKEIISLMPMFLENANSVAKIRYALKVIKLATEHVNLGQEPVIAMDQPLFALAKQIQWQWPETFGEDIFVIVFAGLHIKKNCVECTWTMAGLLRMDKCSSDRRNFFPRYRELFC